LEQKKAEADKTAAEYQAKLAALDVETQKIVAEYVKEGEAEKVKIIEAAKKQAEYIKEQARIVIQQEIKAARDGLQSEVADLSVVAAEEILKKNIMLDDHKRLVQEFMAKVGEAQ
jgi:F-type H+-transporting ATPase subunit b